VLPALAGFNARPTAYGYLLVPNTRTGFIRYERRIRPLHHVSALVDARIVGMRVTSRSAITSLFTHEGEYAARVSVEGTQDRSMRRDFGVVFGDDFASVIDATCIERGEAELYEAAVDTLVHGLVLGAPHRRRRYRYAAPADRTPRVRHLETDWLAGDTLTVFPAERADVDLTFAAARRDDHAIISVERRDEETTLVIAASASRWRAVAARAKHGWLYLMELVAHSARPLDPLLSCCASIELLPAPLGRPAPVLGAFEVE
jgi:hypothetical protein